MSETSPQALIIEISRPFEDAILVVLAGEMDITSSGEYSERLAELGADEATHVVIDLSGLTFLDSTGINALVQSVRSLSSRNCTAVLVAPGPPVQRVFEIARVAEVVEVEHSRAVALERRPAAADCEPPVEDVR